MTTDWHTEDFPELRTRPPWIMEEMIRDQRLLAEGATDIPGASELRELIASAVRDHREIVVTGCGTSEHAAQAIVALTRDLRPDAQIISRQALDAAETPGDPGLVIGISHDGGTRATQLALGAAPTAVTAAITGRSDSAVGMAARTVVATPRLDRSWCHTVAYTSAIIAGAASVGLTADQISAASEVLADDALFENARRIGRKLVPASRIITAGMGVDLIAARELALKIEEGARIPANAHRLETLLHGHLAACELGTTRLVVFAGDPAATARRNRRVSLAIEAASAIGIPAIIVHSNRSDIVVPTGVDSISIDPAASSPLLGTVLGEAFALQALTLGAIDVAGWNPDLIRRESGPYRTAALLADGDPDW